MIFAFLAVCVLIVVNGILSGTEIAMVSLKENQIKKIEEGSSQSDKDGASLLRDPVRYLATIQIGITFAGFLASAFSAVAISDPIGEFVGSIFPPLESVATLASLIFITVALSFLTLVFGELVPKRIALRKAEKWAKLVLPMLVIMNNLVSPLVKLLSLTTEKIIKLLGVSSDETSDEFHKQELREIILSNQAITEEHRNIIRGALEVSEKRVGKVACPRQNVFLLKASIKCGEAVKQLRETQFSRAPVCEDDDLNSTIGVIHLKDLLAAPANKILRNIVREVPFYPESSKVLTVMQSMQKNRVSMSMVVNEYGEVDGMVTIEDLVEEIVGEIYDDYDRSIVKTKKNNQGHMLLPGSFPLYDLPEIGVFVEDGPYSTLAGFMLHNLGGLPEKTGQKVAYRNYLFTVTKLGKHRIEEVSVRYTESQ